MNTVLKIFLSMSCSGSLLILALLLGKHFYKDKISRQWQYYIWLAVVLRLLLPFGPKVNLLGKIYQAAGQAVTQSDPLPSRRFETNPSGDLSVPAAGLEQSRENVSRPAEGLTAVHPLQEIWVLLTTHIWLVWLVAALGLLIRKITVYQGFMRYVKAGLIPVSDLDILDRLSIASVWADMQKPVELCVNPLISSPLLTGFFRPCIVLPGTDISEQNFQYTVLHELTHYKRRDMFYKWLVQIVVCLHWFNPLVYLMSREVTKACEFSCDEAVLAKIGSAHAKDYGKTLLDAMAAAGRYKENLGAVTLSENKQLLKERLGAIMKFKKKSKAVQFLTGMLTLCIIFSAAFAGTYSAAVDVPDGSSLEMETLDIKGTSYYLVYNEAQLRAIGSGEYGMDQNYMQQADIRLSTDEWIPIGTWEHPFTGTFTGNGFEIAGLTMTDPDAEIIGLFGVARNAHIYNVILRDYDITGAGRNITGKSVGAVLAIGQGSRSYDNFVYPKKAEVSIKGHSSKIDQYYKAGSLPLFEITFPRLDKNTQKMWLEKLYADGDISFFSAAVRRLDTNSSQFASFAEKAYTDEEMAFFSILTDRMDEAELELWLGRALEDGKRAFQSILFDKLNRSGESDGLKEKQQKKWAKAQTEEYRAAGVTMDGKDYYYQGQLVSVFLDTQAGKSFCTLNMNPKGTVNIKIVRDAKNKITGVSYLTEAEVTKLLGDMDDPDHKTDIEIIPVDFKKVAAGETVCLGEYTLYDGDEILYDISAKKGNRMKVFFAKKEKKDVAYWSVNNQRQPGEALECTADFTVGPPVTKPGTYQLYLQAPDGALRNVKGSVSIASANAS